MKSMKLLSLSFLFLAACGESEPAAPAEEAPAEEAPAAEPEKKEEAKPAPKPAENAAHKKGDPHPAKADKSPAAGKKVLGGGDKTEEKAATKKPAK